MEAKPSKGNLLATARLHERLARAYETTPGADKTRAARHLEDARRLRDRADHQ